MKLKQITLILFLSLTFSCAEKVSQQEKAIYEKEEIKALNDVFIHLFGEFLIDGYSPGPPPAPLQKNATRNDSIRFENELKFHSQKLEEKKRGIIDTSYYKPMKLYVHDTLIKFNRDIYFSKSELLKHVLSSPRKFDIHQLKYVNAFKLKKLSRYRGSRTGMHFIFSRIIFNQEFNLGYFTYDSYQYGELVTIEKVNNKWVIKNREQMWVE
ncbi:hypothetical protein [Marinifilum fragile]|uniref:hypothetical protein n=1 Tax=Marinifilum fragile TaxID=570161 RepID=UPI0006D27941|nr:hypothetical protein [Marinifilum fragile]